MKILFVCLGNICRSPTAEAVFRARAEDAGLKLDVESAGTGAWHTGEPPDPRAQETGRTRGYSFEGLRAHQVNVKDFQIFDYILAMDRQNLKNLSAMCPSDSTAKLGLFLDYAKNVSVSEVPDPYYGGLEGFEQVVDLIETASDGLIAFLKGAK